MKKLLALAATFAIAVVISLATTFPDDTLQLAEWSSALARRAWAGIEANPLPLVLAFGTFLLTIAYHKLKGKSLRESLEAATTRVTIVPVPAHAPTVEPETPVVVRARARATRAQLIADQIGLENRYRKLPEEVKRAEKEACYTEQAVADARCLLESKRKAHEEAVVKLDALRMELAEGEAELAAIAIELERLAELV
jgi:hypothetical protein